MVNVIIHGCGGKMGHVVAELVKNEPDCQVVAGIDPTTPALDFPVFPNCEACDVAGDVIIDFSTAKAVPALLAFSKAKKIPVVLCTTALSEETTALMQETSKEVAILKSAKRTIEEVSCIPPEEYRAYQELTSKSTRIWTKARQENEIASDGCKDAGSGRI